MYRACLFGAQISHISKQEKGRDSRQVRNLIIISVAFDVKNYDSGLLENFGGQLTSLGHAGSPCFLSFCYPRCIVLTCTILGSVYMKTTVNL